jgi:hypothetical protein
MNSAKWFLKAAPSDFKPYRALTMSARFTASSPNPGSSTVQTFSVSGAVSYEFSISAILTSNSFKYAKISATLTDYLDTTLVQVIACGVSVLCPPATKLTLRRKSSILISTIM